MRGRSSRLVWRVVLLVLGTTPRTVDSDLIKWAGTSWTSTSRLCASVWPSLTTESWLQRSAGRAGLGFLPTGSLQKRKFRYNEHAVPLADIAPSECP